MIFRRLKTAAAEWGRFLSCIPNVSGKNWKD